MFAGLHAEAQMNNRSSGPGKYFDYRAKATNKEGSRWTLSEWMAQKDRNRLMDLWLAMYAPSPYEFYLGGAYSSYDVSTEVGGIANIDKPTYRSPVGKIGAFAYVIGLTSEYENNTEEKFSDLSGALNLRVAGNAVQGTHLLLQYGNRDRFQTNATTGQKDRIAQTFAGADLDLYLMKYFGIHGQYRKYMPVTQEILGEVEGQRTEAGIFLDFEALRIYGNWFSENQNATLNSSTTKTNRVGVQSGIQLFF